jgi:hypothetical protein
LLVSLPSRAEDPDGVAKATAAATAWLALTDAEQYQESWKQASSLFQASVTSTHWQSALQATRLPLGTLKGRTIKSAKYTRSLPGAPDGEYVVVQFESSFENKASAVETVTPSREKDGSWRVSGYFIK